MKKIDWKSKLTSKKFWVAVAGLVTGIVALFGGGGNTSAQISGVILSLGSVIAYIAGEGYVDAANAGTTTQEPSASVDTSAKQES